ncbi:MULTISPECIES: hypothetical protein [unclassified Streptomyces]|uniref:hypothetical protein n=1 Tax=unclassified Streptomyces TaxID=2593676 RepID=UPI000ACD886A|nr:MULTISPECIES: hypothetical protein [unclassified Streptomyces]MCP3771321.1 hypothetical protein [Streptomyces sp. MAR25Y5]
MREDLRGGTAVAVRLAGGAPLRDALVVADPGDWLALDAGVREAAWYRSQLLPEWEHTAPLPADLTHLSESRLALALCHRDGRIREAAVRRSARHPGLLPLIVIRCADWAEPVREHAQKLLRQALDAGAAVDLAPLILRVGHRDRGTFGIELLEEVLGRAPRGRLAVLFAHPDRTVRRFAYRLAVEHRLLCPAELAHAAARDQDTVVQDLCATAALTSLRGEKGAYDEVLTPLLTARSPRTRSAGVTALRRAGRPEQAEPFLGDRSALVRACARYVVRQHGDDPAPWYRKRCAAPNGPGLPPGAVIGLAECGNRADAGLLWPLLAHPAAGVRARAVAGLRALDLADAERLRPLLDDPAPAVVRETTAALLPSVKQLPADWLLERTGPERPRHVRVAAFRLLDAHGGVVALRAAVRLLEDSEVKLRTWAGQSVQRWHPSAEVRRGDAEVGELLDRSRHLFSDHVLLRRKREAGLDG